MWTYDQIDIPLTKGEEHLKYIYETFPECCFVKPTSFSEIKNRILNIPELAKNGYEDLNKNRDFFSENSIFRGEQDVEVYQETRYAPSFWHSHSYFEVICVLKGTCENYFESQVFHMKAGDICIVSPQTVHAISLFGDDCIMYSLEVRSTTFEQTFLNTLPQDSLLFDFFSRTLHAPNPETYLYFKTDKDPVLLALIEEIITESENKKNYFKPLLNSLLTNFFIKLLRNHEKDVLVSNPTGNKSEKNIMFILRYLTEHYDHMTLKELSSFFNYSERQMIRILKEYTNCSFTQLIQQLKLAKAKELLKNKTLSVGKVIDEVGYANKNHFYQLFKQKYNMTPAEYRKSL